MDTVIFKKHRYGYISSRHGKIVAFKSICSFIERGKEGFIFLNYDGKDITKRVLENILKRKIKDMDEFKLLNLITSD